MKKTLDILSVFCVIILILTACGSNDTPIPAPTPIPPAASDTAVPAPIATTVSDTPIPSPTSTALDTGIGTIERLETNVKAGPANNLQDVTAKQYLQNDDGISVTDGGVAQLEFPDQQISIKLFNDTTVGGVSADASGTANRLVRMKLERGGLSGQVVKSGQGDASFEINNGAIITILGTQFFVVFDEDTGITSVGNFDGAVHYAPPGQISQELPAGKQIDILPDNSVTEFDLPFTRSEFEEAAQANSSAIQALRDLRAKYADLTPNSIIKYADGNTLDLETCQGIKFAARVTDPEGVKSVKVQFEINNNDFASPDAELQLKDQGDDLWVGYFNDTISQYQQVTYWRFVATDNNGSVTTQHIEGYYSYYAANFGCP